jgi:hypothetical protein
MQNPRRTRLHSLLLGGMLFAAIVFPYSGQARAADRDCLDLIHTHCGSCHFTNYVCAGLERSRGRFYWRGVVRDMVKKGMATTKAENDQIVRCLLRSDRAAFCP